MKGLPRRSLALPLLAALALAGCEDRGGDGVTPAALDSVFLSVADVEQILAQGVAEATARGLPATLAVTDRVGNVLAVYRMPGAAATVDVVSGLGVTGGLDELYATIPDTSAAISKALTGAYLSSSGNAFSTRTASQIVQLNFNPREANQPSGPLFGVQFSQLPCSDLVRRTTDGDVGPKHAPLGLAADPGGLPLYKNGVVVGGIGVMADGVYGLDLDIGNIDSDSDELIAQAASSGFAAPIDIRANRITADGRTFRYVDATALASNPAAATPATLNAADYVAVAGYSSNVPRAGVRFGSAGSGVEPHPALTSVGAWMLTDSGSSNRYPAGDSVAPATGAGGMTQAEVTQLLTSALDIANRARAQIRRPLGSAAQVSVSVVDVGGNVLGLARTPDAPLFGLDVSLQKARTAGFFSNPDAATLLGGLPVVNYLNGGLSNIPDYVTAARSFFADPALFSGSHAFSARAIGNIHRPTFPDGISGTPNGPLSKAVGSWSPFNVGLQLDLVYNQLVDSVGGDLSVGCTGLAEIANGIQIFPGGVPIYRGSQLIGAIGVSGDGVDQDDMIALLGLARASAALVASGNSNPLASAPIANAPAAMRADQLAPLGVRLRYAQCPQAPFNGSGEQNVCAGL
jgi:uncharacterized protein GlcG (DUF336 family)